MGYQICSLLDKLLFWQFVPSAYLTSVNACRKLSRKPTGKSMRLITLLALVIQTDLSSFSSDFVQLHSQSAHLIPMLFAIWRD